MLQKVRLPTFHLVPIIVCLSFPCAFLYHALHPDSHPGIQTAIIMAAGILLAVAFVWIAPTMPHKHPLLPLFTIGLSLRIISIVIIKNEQVRNMLRRFILNHMKTWRQDDDMSYWCSLKSIGGKWASNDLNPLLARYLSMITEAAYFSILLLALIGSSGIRWRRVLSDPTLAALFLYLCGSIIASCVFEGQPRYHFSLMVIVIIIAGFSGAGLVSVRRKVSE